MMWCKVAILLSARAALAFVAGVSNPRRAAICRAAATEDAFACDVGVVGAGPAGLVLAHALRSRGLNVKVYERRQAFEPAGAAIFLWPFALSSLRAIDARLADELRSAGTVIDRLRVNRFTLNVIGAEASLGEPFLAIRFWDMLRALRSGLPEDAFFLNHRLQRFEHLDDGGARLHFEDAPSQNVRYLIDAGGVNSATRKQLRRDEPIQHVTATYAVSPGDGTPAGELALNLGRGAGVMTASLQGGDVWWTQTEFKESSNPLPPHLEADDTVQTKITELPLSLTWGDKDVTLLGDAAHAQTPSLGLGVSTAFDDIFELATRIDASPNGLTRDTFRDYEASRKVLCALLQLASRASYHASKNWALFAPAKPLVVSSSG